MNHKCSRLAIFCFWTTINFLRKSTHLEVVQSDCHDFLRVRIAEHLISIPHDIDKSGPYSFIFERSQSGGHCLPQDLSGVLVNEDVKIGRVWVIGVSVVGDFFNVRRGIFYRVVQVIADLPLAGRGSVNSVVNLGTVFNGGDVVFRFNC